MTIRRRAAPAAPRSARQRSGSSSENTGSQGQEKSAVSFRVSSLFRPHLEPNVVVVLILTFNPDCFEDFHRRSLRQNARDRAQLPGALLIFIGLNAALIDILGGDDRSSDRGRRSYCRRLGALPPLSALALGQRSDSSEIPCAEHSWNSFPARYHIGTEGCDARAG